MNSGWQHSSSIINNNYDGYRFDIAAMFLKTKKEGEQKEGMKEKEMQEGETPPYYYLKRPLGRPDFFICAAA